jgi:hypothetical protein
MIETAKRFDRELRPFAFERHLGLIFDVQEPTFDRIGKVAGIEFDLMLSGLAPRGWPRSPAVRILKRRHTGSVT